MHQAVASAIEDRPLGGRESTSEHCVRAVSAAAVALFAVLLAGIVAMLFFVVIASGGAGSAAAAITVSNPSDEALEDIPALLFQLFVQEAQQCPGLPWTVMAGISKVESNHGRFGGAVLALDGTIRPPIIGVPLSGSNGTARIPDTDDGRWDGDTVWDRAVGPFQFIPSSWRIFGGNSNTDGLADPNNVFDAVPAMRRHLCPDGRIVDIEAAVFSYNRSAAYVEAVLDWARRYTGPLATAAIPIAGYALPIPASYADEA
ncbi:MAG: lytic transglycosylase domain-containing protein, partial [Acidimicrobiia bacterium]|nr:lytic transglycosylase domain-containing protein [Acidimicrobiia bacterium]